jgi:hypothetical protein
MHDWAAHSVPAFEAELASYPQADIVWLAGGDTGRVWARPDGRMVEYTAPRGLHKRAPEQGDTCNLHF